MKQAFLLGSNHFPRGEVGPQARVRGANLSALSDLR